MIEKLDKFHKTKAGYLLFALIELAITYGFVSLSISRGNLWWYLLTIIFLIGSLQNIFKLMGSLIRGGRKAS